MGREIQRSEVRGQMSEVRGQRSVEEETFKGGGGEEHSGKHDEPADELDEGFHVGSERPRRRGVKRVRKKPGIDGNGHGMGAWTTIYQTYTDEQLVSEIAELKKVSNFSSQTVGGKSYTIDPNLVGEKLRAAVSEQQRRGGSLGSGRQAFVGQVDFSGGVNGAF